MPRILFLLTLMVTLLAGCASPTTQALPPTSTDVATSTEVVLPTATAETAAPPVLPADPTAAAPAADPASSPTAEPAATNSWVSFSSEDGNIWLVDPVNGWLKQITQDASPMQSGQQSIEYCCAKWSWDGTLLAYERTLYTPNPAGGMDPSSSIMVYDVTNGQFQVVAEGGNIAGLAWKPVTHVIGYGLGVAPNYFTTRGEVDSTLATGIYAVNVDNGEQTELVKPERGFSLTGPRWSSTGQFVCFAEVNSMEGSGPFACYNQEELIYMPWNKAIGLYDWSPDDQTLVYDTLTYIPSGTERIYLSQRDGTAEQPFSPDTMKGIAIGPAFSPTGDRIAYFNDPMTNPDMGGTDVKVIVQTVQGGGVLEFGSFTQPSNLGWSPDGQYLVLSAGEYGARQVYQISVADGSIRSLAQGYWPAWMPNH
jgi:dipeptidyl aminopeptidase/acylaminoacyl peptidase